MDDESPRPSRVSDNSMPITRVVFGKLRRSDVAAMLMTATYDELKRIGEDQDT